MAWLMTMTHRRAVDRVRTEQARTTREERAHLSELPLRAGAADPTHDGAVSSLTAARVRDAVSRLPATQREVLDLAYFQGLTHAEMASLLDLPLGTVKSRLRAGVTRLRDELEVG